MNKLKPNGCKFIKLQVIFETNIDVTQALTLYNPFTKSEQVKVKYINFINRAKYKVSRT